MTHLMDTNGHFLNYEQFCIKHNFKPSESDFLKLHKALPQGFVLLTRSILAHYTIQPQLAPLSIQGIYVLDKKCTNHFIRKCFIDYFFPTGQNNNNILQKFDKDSISKLRTMYLTLPIPPKVKETHFKVMNNIYPSKDLLNLRFGIDDSIRTFCDNDVETTDHVFFSCNVAQTFWCDIYNWVKEKMSSLPTSFSRDDITFGLILQNKSDTILCLAKFFIHKCRNVKLSPKLVFFFLMNLKCI